MSATEVGVAYVRLLPSMRGFSAEVTKQMAGPLASAAGKAGDKSGRSFGRKFADKVGSAAKSVVRGIGDTLATGFAVAATGAAGLLASLVSVGGAYNTLEQSALAAFETVLGSQKAAVQMMDDLREFGKTSPFPRQAFIQGTQQLIGFGLEAKKVIPTLDAIQNAVAATGGTAQTLEEIIFVLAKVQGSGEMTAETFNSLGIRGINAAEIIGEQWGKTSNEVREAIRDGTIDSMDAFDMLITGMSERFEGGAEGLKSTAVGAADRIKGAWRDIGSALMEPFIAKGGGGAAVEWFNLVADTLRVLEGTIVPAVADRLAGLAGSFSPLAEAAAEWAQQLDEGAVTRFLEAVAPIAPVVAGLGTAFATAGARSIPVLGTLAAGINPVVAGIGAMALASPELREALSGIAAAAQPVVTELLRGLQPALEAIAPVVAQLAIAISDALLDALEAIAPAIPPLADLLVALGESAAELLPPLLDIGVNLLEALVPAVIALLPAIEALLPPFTAFAVAAAELVAALPPSVIQGIAAGFLAFKTAQTVAGPLTAARDAIQGISQVAATFNVSRLTALKGVLSSSAQESGKLQRVLTPLRTGLTTVGAAAKTAATSLMSWVKAGARATATAVRATAAIVAKKVALIASKAATAVATAAQWAFNVAVSANPIMLVVLALAALVAGIIWAFNNVEWFRDLVTGAFEMIQRVVANAIGFISRNWQTILAILTGPVGIAVRLILAHKDKIVGFFKAGVDFVKRHWKNILAILTGPIGIAVRVISSNWDTIKRGFTSVRNWIRDRINDVTSSFRRLAGRIGDALSGIKKAVSAPFRAGFNAIKTAWNATAGGFTFPSIKIPDFPGVPGRGSTIGGWTIPKMHTGGIFRAGGGEGFALLADGEGVFTREQMAALAPAGSAPGPTVVQIVPTGGMDDLARAVAKWVRVKHGGNVQVALQGAR